MPGERSFTPPAIGQFEPGDLDLGNSRLSQTGGSPLRMLMCQATPKDSLSEVRIMGSRKGGFGVLIGAAVGALFLVPADVLAQAEVFRQDPCSDLSVIYVTRSLAVSACAAGGIRSRPVQASKDVRHWLRRAGGPRRSGSVGSVWPPTRDCPQPNMISD